MTSEPLISYFLGELLVLSCQINPFIFKSILRHLKILQAAENCGPYLLLICAAVNVFISKSVIASVL